MTHEERIKHIEECAARASLSPEIQPAPKPSPLTIEINEGLFEEITRDKKSIMFKTKSGAWRRILSNGDERASGCLQAKERNAIDSVRAALNWTGKE